MRKVYFFIGVMGSGKNFYANKLKEIYPSEQWDSLDFKTSLINFVSSFCGYDVTKDYDNFKENVFGVNDKSESDVLKNKYPNILTGRDLLQKIGTELFRKYDTDFWVKEFSKNLYNLRHNIACCDLRFENELQYAFTLINKFDVNFVLCDYHSERYSLSNHPSEILAQKMLNYVLPRKDKFETFYDSNAYILDHKTAGMFLF